MRSFPYRTVFSSLALLYLLAYFCRVSLPVIASELASELGLSGAQLGTVSSALFLCFALAQVPVGLALDRLGPRALLPVLALVGAGGSLLFALADCFEALVLARGLQGLGTAAVLMGALKVYAARFPPSRFATLSGLQVSIGNLGNLLATAPLAWAATAFGWRPAFLLVALLTLAAGVLVWRILPPEAPSQGRDAAGPMLAGLKELGASAEFRRLALLAFFWYGSYMAVQGLWGGPLLMQGMGLERQTCGLLLSLTATGFILGCPLWGSLSDRLSVSRRSLLLSGQLGLAGCVLFLAALAPRLAVPVLYPLFFFLGFFVSSGPLLYGEAKDLAGARRSATAMASLNFFVMIGAALTQQCMGVLVDALGGAGRIEALQWAFVLPACGLLVACFLCRSAPRTRKSFEEVSP